MVYLPHRGFTLTESMVAVSIVAILTMLAAPSYLNWRQQSEFVAALRQSHLLLHQGRTHALSHRKTVNVAIDPSHAGCLGLTTGSTCNCHQVGKCHIGGQEFRLTYATLNSRLEVAGDEKKTITFDGTHGMGFSSALSLSIVTDDYEGRVVVSNLGRSRMCSLANAIATSGIPKC